MNSPSKSASNQFDTSFPSVKITIIVTTLSASMNSAYPISGGVDIVYYLMVIFVASGVLWYFVWCELYGKIQGKTVSFLVHVVSTALVPSLSDFFTQRIIIGT